ncbi:MAG TPA: GNAT family protein [Nocardioides sp.]
MTVPSPSLVPAADLVVRAGRLELRALTDDLLVALGELAARGVHPPDAMPFVSPWASAPPAELPLRVAQYHWGVRSRFAPAAWTLELAALWDGELVGVQAVATTDYLLTRTGETGSWLGAAHQGRGIGTAMRRALCVLLVDHLDAQEVTSEAYADNVASLAVSRKVGNVPDGSSRVVRSRAGREEAVVLHRLVLRPEALVRGDEPVAVSGVAPLRRLVGLDRPD